MKHKVLTWTWRGRGQSQRETEGLPPGSEGGAWGREPREVGGWRGDRTILPRSLHKGAQPF